MTISLPQREFGYRTTPLTWSELVQIITVERNLAKLSRNEKQQLEYERFRQSIREEWLSIYDYILHTKFHFAKVPAYEKEQEQEQEQEQECHDNQGKKQKFQASPRLDEITTVSKVLTLNDYPYYLDSNIRHYILWKTVQPITPLEIEETKALLQQHEHQSPVTDILYWINPPSLQSLPGIDHVHFLCQLQQPI